MKKVVKKKMTIDDLAIMVASGFQGVDSRLDKVDSRLDKVDSRLDKVESRLGVLEEEVKDLSQNVKSTRRDMLNMGDKFVTHRMFDELASRVYLLEKKKQK